jgi:hypothetical protein
MTERIFDRLSIVAYYLRMKHASDLNDFLAAQLGIEPSTVATYSAYLRRGGLLPASPGGRGKRGGAIVSDAHAALMLVALLSSSTARRCAEAAVYFGTFEFSHIVWRHVTAAGEHHWTQEFEGEDAEPLQGPFLAAMARWIGSYRAGGTDPETIRPVSIGVNRKGPIPSCWVELVVSVNVGGGALLVSAVYLDAGPVHPAPSAPIEKLAVVPARILRSVAEFLGPTHSQNSRDAAKPASPQVH